MAIMRFRISGQDYTFDWGQDLSAADLWALDEMGVAPRELESTIRSAGQWSSEEEIARDGAMLDLGMRALCAVTFLAYRRADGDATWREFSRTIVPATFEILGVDQPPANRADRRAAAKRSGKATATKATATKATASKTTASKVGEALADAGAAG